MPEELGIALVIIVAVGWILIKILQAFGRAIGETLKGLSDARSARNKRISAARLADKKANFDKNKHSLSQYLTVTVPDQLDSAEQLIRSLRSHFDDVKQQTKWTAERPSWTQEEFRPYTLPAQDEDYRDMNVTDNGITTGEPKQCAQRIKSHSEMSLLHFRKPVQANEDVGERAANM